MEFVDIAAFRLALTKHIVTIAVSILRPID